MIIVEEHERLVGIYVIRSPDLINKNRRYKEDHTHPPVAGETNRLQTLKRRTRGGKEVYIVSVLNVCTNIYIHH
jgi:hypothetical protein